jgi:hypothetical protein
MKHKELNWTHTAGSAVSIIIDDTEHVWQGARNLVVIDPYMFFQAGSEVNNRAGQSLAPSQQAQRLPGPPPTAPPPSTAPGSVVAPTAPTWREESRSYLLDILVVRLRLRLPVRLRLPARLPLHVQCCRFL